MRQPKQWITALLLIAMTGIAASEIAAAPQPKVAVGTLAGTVLDAQSKPVANATVTMQTSYGTRPHATHTDANGKFEFARYRTGQYDLRAFAGGVFSEWTKRAIIRAGKPTQVTLRIPTAAK